jgi:imidazolonepropionase-like amidohydrolase
MLKLLLTLMFVCSFGFAQSQPIVIQAGTLFDGQGHVTRNAQIVVQDGKIVRVDPNGKAPTTYNLSRLTVMPGFIDVHTHVVWHFGPDDKIVFDLNPKTETPEFATLAYARNAYVTLMAGFTTIQSLGSEQDKDLRDAIANRGLPGPRMLTALRPISDPKLTPDEIREWVRKLKTDGADVVKIFASGSIRQGGVQTLSDEQLQAACGEATAQGLRSVVHAYGKAVRAAANAGCTEVEHGTFATQEDLDAMAAHGTWFDPQVGLVIHNYFENKAKYLGVDGYTEEGFAKMQEVLPIIDQMFKRALATKGLKIVFGTDAVAGAHGHNAEEFIDRVHAGQQPMDALVAAQSRAAASLRMEKEIGTIAPGMQADIIALDGDPLQDISAVRRVVFVMKGGTVYKNVASGR